MNTRQLQEELGRLEQKQRSDEAKVRNYAQLGATIHGIKAQLRQRQRENDGSQVPVSAFVETLEYSRIFVEAHLTPDNLRRICVDIGLGCYLELDLDEAADLVQKLEEFHKTREKASREQLLSCQQQLWRHLRVKQSHVLQ